MEKKTKRLTRLALSGSGLQNDKNYGVNGDGKKIKIVEGKY